MSVGSALEAYLENEEKESREIRVDSLRKLLRVVGMQRKALLGGACLILLGTSATLLEPRLLGLAIDEALVPRDFNRLRQFALLYLAVECIRFGAVVSNAYLFEKLGQNVMLELRTRLFSRLQLLPMSAYDRNPAGRLVTRVTNDIASLAEMFSAGFVTLFGNVLVLVGILGWLIALDLRLGLISAAVLPIMIWAGIVFSAWLRVAYRNSRTKLSALNAFLAENILGMRVVHLFNRQKLHLGRFSQVNHWYADAQIASVRVFAYFQPTITLATGVAMALVVYYGGVRVGEGTLKLGVLVAYFSYVMSLFQPVREIADKWNVFLSGMASAERIFSILSGEEDWKPELPDDAARVPARALANVKGHIRFENVWFAYGGEHWVLKDLSLDIPAGTRVGFVGHTGAGKSTVISLLMRFYEPQRGRILLDGVDLREYDKRELRAAIGIIQQEVFLFTGSTRDNLTLWREPDVEVEGRAREVLGSLGLDHWLSPSEDEKTGLAERGSNLSMGQRQVLSFTRALVSRPSVWILDEATANVDSGTEIEIDRALEKAARGRTTLMIAHRLATVRTADQIVVLHKGELLERGTHRELLEANGLYARLYRYQGALETAAAAPVTAGAKATPTESTLQS